MGFVGGEVYDVWCFFVWFCVVVWCIDWWCCGVGYEYGGDEGEVYGYRLLCDCEMCFIMFCVVISICYVVLDVICFDYVLELVYEY